MLELRTKASKEQNKLQESSRDKGKRHSETQAVHGTVSLIVVVYETIQCAVIGWVKLSNQR